MLAGLLSYLGQFLAAYFWQGIFSLEFNLISDLGVTECQQINDSFLVRYACSPGYLWFSAGFILAGLALLAGAVQIFRSTTDALGRELAGTKPMGSALVVAAGGMILAGAVAYNAQALVHAAGMVLILVGFWVAMVWSVWSARRASRAVGAAAPAPVLSKTMLPITVLLLLISVVGAVLFVASPETAAVGMYLRLALDPAWIWLFALGAALLVEGSPRRRKVREKDRAARRTAREQRDAALRKAAQQ